MERMDVDGDLAWRCHANCMEYSREMARNSGPKGDLVERDGVLLFASGSDFPVLLNGAFRLDPAVDADSVIDLADGWFAERGRGWSLATTSWGGSDDDLIAAAARRGLLSVTDAPGMVCDQRVDELPVPDGVEVRRLDGNDATAFISMIDLAYTSLGMPVGALAATATDPPRMPPPHVVTIAAFDGDDLVSGAQVMFSHGIAGVYSVGTAESARGRGLAELVTRIVTNIGFDGGAGHVTLQATSMGEPIYRRIGYRELYRYVTHTRFA